jgi:L-serine/L-threonine ammonia-lyase
MPLHIETPLIISDILSDLVNKDIRLKLDALQPSGSFKIRGIGFACEYFALRGQNLFCLRLVEMQEWRWLMQEKNLAFL